jgi:hypothetical protein
MINAAPSGGMFHVDNRCESHGAFGAYHISKDLLLENGSNCVRKWKGRAEPRVRVGGAVPGDAERVPEEELAQLGR